MNNTPNKTGAWVLSIARQTPLGGMNYADGTSYDPPGASVEASTTWDVPAINAIGNVATTIGNAVTAFNTSRANKVVAQYQAQIQENNARMAELSALSALNQSQWKIASITMRAGKIKSSQKVAMAANGIKVGVGSSRELLATTDLMKRIDVNTEYANGYRAAWGYRTEAIQANMKATALRGTARSQSPFAAGATYFAAGILDTYKNYAKGSK